MNTHFYSFIIPHANEGYLIDIMLDSMEYWFGNYDNYEIILIDDESDKAHQKGLETLMHTHALSKKMRVFFTNVGAIRAKNLGAQKARGDYLVFLDAHMFFIDNFLQKLDALIAQSGHGFDLLQAWIGTFDSKHNHCSIFALKNAQIKHTQWHSPKVHNPLGFFDTPNIGSACLIISKQVFEALDGFHPFFEKFGFEDIEFSMRAALRGYRCVLTNKLKVPHYFKKYFFTKITSFHLLHNKLMFLFTCFQESKKREYILSSLEEKTKYPEFFKQVYSTVINNKAAFEWIAQQKAKFIFDEDRFFHRFRSYHEGFFPENI